MRKFISAHADLRLYPGVSKSICVYAQTRVFKREERERERAREIAEKFIFSALTEILSA